MNIFKYIFSSKYRKMVKFEAIAFGELAIEFQDDNIVDFTVLFYENSFGDRYFKNTGPYKFNGSRYCFESSHYYGKCLIWKDTGLLPTWAKDPMEEKLKR